jgi:hypothetical protein
MKRQRDVAPPDPAQLLHDTGIDRGGTRRHRMTDARTRRQTEPEELTDRIGKYGGDDGALEHEREEIQPGEEPGIEGVSVSAGRSETPAEQAERQQQRDLATGAENPG